MEKILIVEDDEKLREELKIFLINNGYEVNALNNFENTLESILKSNSNLILLDVNLPNNNGEYLCKEIRKTSNVPIIIVTSKNTEIDELLSINYGADDFITKPYNPQILLARIESILKRINKIEKNTIEYKDMILDVSKSIIIRQDKRIELSRNELRILYYLLKNKGTIISRDEIMNNLWDDGDYVDDNTLTVNINRLRNKLETIGIENAIETRRGQGYIII